MSEQIKSKAVLINELETARRMAYGLLLQSQADILMANKIPFWQSVNTAFALALKYLKEVDDGME